MSKTSSNEGIVVFFLSNTFCCTKKTLESPLDCKEIKPVNPKGNQSWIFIRRTDVEAEAPILWPPDAKSWLIHWKRPWCWETLRAREEGGDRGRDGWMVSLTQWTWVWTNSRRRWRTGKPDVLQAMGSQRVRHNWATDQQTKSGNPRPTSHCHSEP